jgi:hypothetical protein
MLAEVRLLSPQSLGPATVVEHLLGATRAELAGFGSLLLVIRTPEDSEPDFGPALEGCILKSESAPYRASPQSLITAEIPTLHAPPDDESDIDQAEMLAELSSAEHWVAPLGAYNITGLRPHSQHVVRVGRAQGASLRLTDRSVSAQHAEFTLADGGVRLADAGSKNGTVHNGTELRPSLKVWLQPMDRIRFGRVECFVCDPRALRAVLRHDSRSFH